MALAAALTLTLGAKAALTNTAPKKPDAALFLESVETHLRENGFRTGRMRRPFATLVLASDGACRMMIGDYRPYGTFAEPLASDSRGVGPLHYVWRGKRSDSAPKLLPLMEYYVERELRRVGLEPPRHPILAVAASEACDNDRIDWTPLAALPR